MRRLAFALALLIGAGAAQASGLYGPFVSPATTGFVLPIGAIGDGVADDSAAISTWCNTGGNLLLPRGTYVVDNVQCALGTTPTRISGPGKLITKTASDLPTLRINCSNGTALVDIGGGGLTLDGNRLVQTHGPAIAAHGLYVVSCPSLIAHDMRIQSVAGHGLFISNPSSPSDNYSAQEIHDVQLYDIGNGNDTYGSALVITNGVRTKISNVSCNTAAKACYRFSGDGLHFSNVTARDYGNGGFIPVSGSSSNITISGGKLQDGTIFSDTSVTGNTQSGSPTVSGLSANVITAKGWRVGYDISGTNIPASSFIGAIAADGLSLTLTDAAAGGTPVNATGNGTGIALTVNNATSQNTNDGVRCVGTDGIIVNGATITGNPGNGVGALNGCNKAVFSNNLVKNNGKAAAAATSTGGRSGIKVFNSSSASLDVNIAGNQIYDDQGSPTQDYDIEVTNSSDYVNARGNDLGVAELGLLNNTSSGTHNEFAGNIGLADIIPPRIITAAGAVTVTSADKYICIRKASGAATTVNLNASPFTGRMLRIKDCKGDAATNNITITPAAGNIDGSGTFVINTNWGAWIGSYDGTEWATEASR